MTRKAIMATYQGQRSKFYKVESYNVGEGGGFWGRFGGGAVVRFELLQDVEELDEPLTQLDYLRSLPGGDRIKTRSNP